MNNANNNKVLKPKSNVYYKISSSRKKIMKQIKVPQYVPLSNRGRITMPLQYSSLPTSPSHLSKEQVFLFKQEQLFENLAENSEMNMSIPTKSIINPLKKHPKSS